MSGTVSTRFSSLFTEQLGPSREEIKFGVMAVLIFIAGTCLYCLSYQVWVAAITPNLTRTAALSFREWGVWLPLTPLAFRMFRNLDARAPWHQQTLAGVALAFIAALAPTAIDQLTGTRPVISSLALFWPRFVAMALVIYLLWRVLLRRAPRASIEPPATAARAQPSRPETLLVSKGADQCLIRLSDVQHASAAGNYIELWAGNQRFLVRSTMGKLEELLPPSDYVRIHRSHLVRVDQIARIRTHRSSNGTVHLRSGHTLPLSKGCRAELLGHNQELAAGMDSSR
ncbi:LytTR family DNA-binding domain-containing protein [Povalibacter sp.]|uniref:LytR/AlgR family response regulator transcription factor n=1 Tax=Povalibacter sp. TaxID=1962978 RepID=UPI002F3EA1E8